MTARVAIVPARSGSKRIPHKNVAPFHGKPLLAWSIEAARETQRFDRVIVSTDSEEVAAVARSHGAEVPFLRDSFADDHSPVSLATAETVERLRRAGDRVDVVVQLFAVCPLRTAGDIVDALEAFERRAAPFQISCFDYGFSRPWWAVRLDGASRPTVLFPEVQDKRSQDLEPLFCPTGATWVADADALVRERTFFGRDHRFHPMPWLRAIDIDTPEDLELAEALFDYARAKR